MVGIAGVLGRHVGGGRKSHCNITIDSSQFLDEEKQIMALVKVMERWQAEK